MKNNLSKENEQRLSNIQSRIEKNNVVDMSFSGHSSGDKELGYMESVLGVLEKNQDWLDENARKKAKKYL
jgi:hypothetical protein